MNTSKRAHNVEATSIQRLAHYIGLKRKQCANLVPMSNKNKTKKTKKKNIAYNAMVVR